MWNRTTVQNAACRPIAPAGNSVYNLYLNGAMQSNLPMFTLFSIQGLANYLPLQTALYLDGGSRIQIYSEPRAWRPICSRPTHSIRMVAVGSY